MRVYCADDEVERAGEPDPYSEVAAFITATDSAAASAVASDKVCRALSEILRFRLETVAVLRVGGLFALSSTRERIQFYVCVFEKERGRVGVRLCASLIHINTLIKTTN
jgi:hypothetical protein